MKQETLLGIMKERLLMRFKIIILFGIVLLVIVLGVILFQRIETV